MRYLSEDGKLFNTAEECQEHEEQIRKEELKKEEIKRAEAKRREKEEGNKDILKLIKILDDAHNSGTKDEEKLELLKLVSMVENMKTVYDELEEAMVAYEKKHNTSFHDTKKKDSDHSSDILLDMLRHL